MARETGKQRSQRIEIDYYRKRTDIHVWRTVCILVGLLGASAYAGYVLMSGDGSQLSTGPVTAAHAAFENDCNQCHQNFTPIGSDGVDVEWSLVGLSKSKSIEHMESACQSCHRVGSHHRVDEMTDSWQLRDKHCSSCHMDHQGRDNDLTAVASTQCTNCHAGIADGCTGTPSVKDSILAFTDESHGPFNSLLAEKRTPEDLGQVKFDHHQHMAPGQVDPGSEGGFTLAMLSEANQKRYKANSDGMVTLDCSSCHEMSGNPDPGEQLIADGELGRYIKPISFEQHCSACHALNPGIATADSTPLPHAASWDKVKLLVKASIVGARLNDQSSEQADQSEDETPSPPRVGAADPLGSPPLFRQGELDRAILNVRTECQKCHEDKHLEDDYIAKAASGQAAPLIPPRWLERGIYDHAAHRQLDCKLCHASAYRSDDSVAGPPLDHQTVMIDNVESCTGCHRDAELATPESLTDPDVVGMLRGMTTWASDDCIMCHRYHTPVAAEIAQP